jgi:predicted metal-dependent hydrolase
MKARFPKFDFSGIKAHWTRNPEFAQNVNAASLVPAYIEPFLLKIMQHARKDLDPSRTRLLSDLDIFIKQEMQHCKQHIAFNKRMHELGYMGLKPFEREFEQTFEYFLTKKPRRFNLAYCEGFESISATACELYFEDYNELLEGADPEPTNMWRWHLAEEFEHRTVCSDVYHELAGLAPVPRYFYRVYGYFYAMFHLLGFTQKVAKFLIEQDRSTMTPEQVQVSIAREKAAKKVMGRRFGRMTLRIMAPWYDPAKRRPPRGYQDYLDNFEATRSVPPQLVA